MSDKDDYNGYLDCDQTFTDFYCRELGGSIAQLQDADPARCLREWWKKRKAAQNASIGTAILGCTSLVGGLLVGAPFLTGAGVLVGLMSGLSAWHHGKGATAHQVERETLDDCPMLIPFLAQLEAKGIGRSELVSAYDSLIRAVLATQVNPKDPAQLKQFFQAKLESRSTFAQTVSGFDAPAAMQTQLATEASPPPVSPNRHEPIPTPDIREIPIKDLPVLQPPEPTPQPSQASIAPIDNRFAWAKDLLHFPAVLIWGAQGSGKTSFAAWLLRQRILSGHGARVFDPHASYGQWKGLKVIGSGMNFSACDIAMQDFIGKVKKEYQARAKQPDYKPTRETVLVDEFTQWAANCPHSSDFFVTALSDIRKIQKGVIFISHDRSLAGLGGAKGFSQARDNGLAELHLQCIVDPATGEPRPAMKGKLKIPGKAAIEVEISPEMNGSMDFADLTASADSASATTLEQQQLRDRLEGLYRESPETSETKPEIISESPETSETVSGDFRNGETDAKSGVSDDADDSISDFVSSEIDPDRVRRVLEMKRNEMKQTQIIAIEWGAKAGDNQPYKDAVAQYKAILDRYGKGEK